MNWLSHFRKELHSPTGFDCGHCTKATKCCDFTPFFPNFLVGASLEVQPEQTDRFRSMDPQRFHPLGIFPLSHSKRICDFFDKDSRLCRNWSHRPSECASYFCEAGLKRVGLDHKIDLFKEQSASLFEAELYLSQWVLEKAGFSRGEISTFVDHWNAWVDGEALDFKWSLEPLQSLNLYKALWQHLKALSWEELKSQLKINELSAFEKHLKMV